VGLVHYRRFFAHNAWDGRILSFEEIGMLLKRFDIIVPAPFYTGPTVQTAYSQMHNLDDLTILSDILEQRCPEYLQDFHTVMNRHYIHPFNMFIAQRKTFDSYMQWVMPLLVEIDHSIDVEQYDSYNKRVIGFLAERMLNIWLLHHETDLQICQMPVFQTDLSRFRSFAKSAWHALRFQQTSDLFGVPSVFNS
jgi:hypothetical protein